MTPGTQSVKPDHILHELSELWPSLSKQEPGKEEDSGALRACAMTLIAFVDNDSDSMALSDTLGRIMRSHPSRAILVRLREDAGVLESRVFAQCWLPPGHHRRICCEQVELSDLPEPRGRYSVRSSRLAAFPTCPASSWFRSSGIAGRRAPVELRRAPLLLGDKMIVDSARSGAPTFADLPCAGGMPDTLVGDLAWTRLTKLRQLIAQLLSGRDPSTVHNVSIEYSGAEATCRKRGDHLQAWLRSEFQVLTRSRRAMRSKWICAAWIQRARPN